MRIEGSKTAAARLLRAGTATVLAGLCGPVVAVLATAAPARAATHAVTTTQDVDDVGACADDAVTTGTGPDNLVSLREAVCRARNAGTGTVTVPAGTYTLTQGALAIKGGNGKVQVTVDGAGATSTVIDGNAADRVVNIDPTEAGDVHVVLSRLAVRNGRPTDGYGGGGVLAGAPRASTGNSLSLAQCRITGNTNDSAPARTNAPGGGVAVAGGDLTVTDCVISGNTSGSSAGGGVYFSAQRAADDLIVDGTTFSANTMANTSASAPGATSNGGGALAVRADVAGGSMDITGTRFTGNTATGAGTGADARGGAVYVRSGSPTFTGSVFTGNTATGTGGATGEGGALYAAGTATLTLSRVVGNTASTGGAVVQNGGTLTVARTWWGCNQGPNATGCDEVTSTAGDLVTEPHLTLGVTVAPSSLATDATATATAGFRTDSAGGAVAGDDLSALTGVPVTWSATGGALSDQQNAIGSGRATATYTGSAAGAGSVRAVVDGQQVDGAVTVTASPVAPTAPTIGTATVTGPGTLTVAWTAPPGTVDSYRVHVAGTGPYAAVQAGTCAGAPTAGPCTVTGLTPGVPYTFQVSAVRAGLEGPRSDASTAVTALAAATAPTAPAATPADGGAVITWTPPPSTAGVTGYTATLEPGGKTCGAPGAGATTCAVDGLTNGTGYTVTVVAHSPAGDSPASGPAGVRPGLAPGTPTGVQAVAGVASLTVSWTAPASAGTGIAGYLVTASPGPATCQTTGATSCVLGAEAGKDYTVTVVARGTHGGDSAASQPSTAVRPTTPEPPAAPPVTPLTLTTDQGATTRVEPGQQMVVSGTGFAPYSTVTITVYSAPVVLATVTTDGTGSFSVPVTVPSGLEEGKHSFVALGVDPDGGTHSLRLDLTVPASSDDTGDDGGDGLPVTGAGIILMVVTGLSLLLGGVALRRMSA
jgi:hypothetical protein